MGRIGRNPALVEENLSHLEDLKKSVPNKVFCGGLL